MEQVFTFPDTPFSSTWREQLKQIMEQEGCTVIEGTRVSYGYTFKSLEVSAPKEVFLAGIEIAKVKLAILRGQL